MRIRVCIVRKNRAATVLQVRNNFFRPLFISIQADHGFQWISAASKNVIHVVNVVLNIAMTKIESIECQMLEDHDLNNPKKAPQTLAKIVADSRSPSQNNN